MRAGESVAEPVADREVVITRVFDAPARLLFEAWSKPEHLMHEMPGAEKMIVTVTYDEKAGKTTLTIHTLFASVAMRNEHVGGGFEQGVGSGLDQLAGVVARMRAAERS